MKAFTYQRADSAAQAAAAAVRPGAKIIAGGTNLLDLMKLEIETPQHLAHRGAIGSRYKLDRIGGQTRSAKSSDEGGVDRG